jgi:hypothetical protein
VLSIQNDHDTLISKGLDEIGRIVAMEFRDNFLSWDIKYNVDTKVDVYTNGKTTISIYYNIGYTRYNKTAYYVDGKHKLPEIWAQHIERTIQMKSEQKKEDDLFRDIQALKDKYNV